MTLNPRKTMSVSPTVLILRAPGTNCNEETAWAFERAGARTQQVHINALLESPRQLDTVQILCLPGGFSYGDDIAAGRILASQLTGALADVMGEFHESGKLILGICNGFQVLVKSGFLFPADEDGLPATLTWNDSGRFVDRWVHLATSGTRCVFLRNIDTMYLPIAHAEGKFVARNDALLDAWDDDGRLAIRYGLPDGRKGQVTNADNPNGSVRDVAGVCDVTGRIFGLMPHPERHIEGIQHPQWTRKGPAPVGDGLAIFQNAVDYFG